jgi:nucleoside-diphosphate-sugar epimerase
MKIIVTGATGSLGAYLTRWLSGKGHDVIGVGRVGNPPARLLQCSRYIRANIASPFSLPEADVCIHTAAIADDKAKPADLFAANVTGTKNVADAALHCKVFVHVSTSSVYTHSNSPRTEEMIAQSQDRNLSAYGRSKLLAEDILRKNYKNDSCFILRPRGIYGAGDKVLLPRLLKLVSKSKMLSIGSMNVKLSLTHFANFAHAVECCLQSDKKGIHYYNVADDQTYVLYDVVKKLLTELYSSELPVKKIPLWILQVMAAFRIGGITPLFLATVSKNLVLDISKIKDELGYRPVTNLDQSLKEIANWVKFIGGVDTLQKADAALAWKVE